MKDVFVGALAFALVMLPMLVALICCPSLSLVILA
jgi:hypothetical protein